MCDMYKPEDWSREGFMYLFIENGKKKDWGHIVLFSLVKIKMKNQQLYGFNWNGFSFFFVFVVVLLFQYFFFNFCLYCCQFLIFDWLYSKEAENNWTFVRFPENILLEYLKKSKLMQKFSDYPKMLKN